jgi:hypothetical protein
MGFLEMVWVACEELNQVVIPLCAATVCAYALAAFFAGIDSRERIGSHRYVF